MFSRLLAGVCLCLPMAAYAISEEALFEQINQLNWIEETGDHAIPNNDAVFALSDNEVMVVGSDAHRLTYLTEGHDQFKPDAVILRVGGDQAESQVLVSYADIGHVKTDDWEEMIDANEMLESIKEGTAEANRVREEGYASVYIDDWAQEPHLNRQESIIYWAINGHDSNNNQFVNAKALKLGRHGYTELLWVGAPTQFVSAEAVMQPLLAAYRYNEGARYADFVPETDTVAAVGAGALVYKMITGKVGAKVGAGLIAAALIFLKKFWFVIVLPFVWLWNRMKGKEKAA